MLLAGEPAERSMTAQCPSIVDERCDDCGAREKLLEQLEYMKLYSVSPH